MANYTPDNIESLDKTEIFVFGANKAGTHFGGAALLAFQKYGATWGKGEGLSGNSYAFPTLDENFEKLPLSEIKNSFRRLRISVLNHPQYRFYLTKVGCGIAGFSIEEIANTFNEVFQDKIPENLSIPIEFVSV